jgi:hypothetical protein
MDHSEFPWGPEAVPGLLTPLGVAGWIVVAVLALLLLNALRGGEDKARKAKGQIKEIGDTYDMILAAARHALSLDDYAILGGANLLRKVIQTRLGRTLKLGGDLGKHLKTIGEAMGEKDKAKDKHKAGGHGHGGGHGGGGAALAAVGNNVHGPSITVNVGLAEKPEADGAAHGHDDGHDGGHDDHGHGGHGGHDDHDKPLSLEDQLDAVRKAVREFEKWWSDRAGRVGDMQAALKDFTDPEPLDDLTKKVLQKNETK